MAMRLKFIKYRLEAGGESVGLQVDQVMLTGTFWWEMLHLAYGSKQ